MHLWKCSLMRRVSIAPGCTRRFAHVTGHLLLVKGLYWLLHYPLLLLPVWRWDVSPCKVLSKVKRRAKSCNVVDLLPLRYDIMLMRIESESLLTKTCLRAYTVYVWLHLKASDHRASEIWFRIMFNGCLKFSVRNSAQAIMSPVLYILTIYLVTSLQRNSMHSGLSEYIFFQRYRRNAEEGPATLLMKCFEYHMAAFSYIPFKSHVRFEVPMMFNTEIGHSDWTCLLLCALGGSCDSDCIS